MAQLVFQSVSGGTTTLNGTNTAGTYNLTVPAADGTLLYQDTSGNITFNNVTITGLLSLTGTGAFKIPVGNTAQRPTPVAGDIRYNTDGGGLYEGYLPAVSAWYKFSMVPEGQYSINYLAVGGGAGGTFGGGGGGSVLISVLQAIPSTVLTITVGAGGAQTVAGNNSSIAGIAVANGGAIGSSVNGGASGNSNPGGLGGQGGVSDAGGGGGGASQGGGSNSGAYGGSGGGGSASTITGGTVYYGGGGGGTGGNTGGNSGGAGGQGGGGAGGYYIAGATPPTYAGSPGTANTGGGGGGTYGGGVPAGAGGSGIVVLSMAAASYTGTITGSPTVVNTGTTVILTYRSSGTYTA